MNNIPATPTNLEISPNECRAELLASVGRINLAQWRLACAADALASVVAVESLGDSLLTLPTSRKASQS